MIIEDLLRKTTPESERQPAITKPNSKRDLSYRQLREFVEASGSDLVRAGVQREDVVALSLPNGPEAATAFLATASVAAAAPLNPGLTRSEFAFYLEDLGVRTALVAEDDRTACSAAAGDLGIPVIRVRVDPDAPAGSFRLDDGAAEPVRWQSAEPDDVALYLHTSGTTSRPKMVPLTHRNLCQSAENVAHTLRLTEQDVCLNVMPLFHIHGLVAALLASLSAGSAVACTSGFDAPRFFGWFEDVRPTWYTAVPTMHQAILARAGQAEREFVVESPLRLIRSSSSSLAPSVLRGLEDSFGVPVVEAYGMTEAAHQMTCNPLPPAVRKPGSVGPPAGPEVAIADEAGRFLAHGSIGEVVIRGPNVTAGYRGVDTLDDHFHPGGWFRTGDQGYLDKDGYLFLTGRLKEIINRGGETIAPREIDEALLEHPEIRQAVAFAIPDESLGEEVGAAVVREPGSTLDEPTVQTFVSEKMSFARIPKRIVFVGEIPKGPTGKLQRIGLAGRLGIEGVRRGFPAISSLTGDSKTIAQIAGIWTSVLGSEDVDPDLDFLDVGGDSITAAQVVVRIREMFDLDVSLVAVYNAVTVREQAALVDELLGQRRNAEAD